MRATTDFSADSLTAISFRTRVQPAVCGADHVQSICGYCHKDNRGMGSSPLAWLIRRHGRESKRRKVRLERSLPSFLHGLELGEGGDSGRDSAEDVLDLVL